MSKWQKSDLADLKKGPLEQFKQIVLLSVHQYPSWAALCQNREKVTEQFWSKWPPSAHIFDKWPIHGGETPLCAMGHLVGFPSVIAVGLSQDGGGGASHKVIIFPHLITFRRLIIVTKVYETCSGFSKISYNSKYKLLSLCNLFYKIKILSYFFVRYRGW